MSGIRYAEAIEHFASRSIDDPSPEQGDGELLERVPKDVALEHKIVPVVFRTSCRTARNSRIRSLIFSSP